MTTRQPSARRTVPIRTAPVPQGARRPQTVPVLWLIRAMVFSALALAGVSSSMLDWAATQPSMSDADTTNSILTDLLLPTIQDPRVTPDTGAIQQQESATAEPVAAFLAALIRWLLTPQVIVLLNLISAIAIGILSVEALLAFVYASLQHRQRAKVPTSYLLVRAVQPVSTGRTAGGSAPGGDQFFRALQQVIPKGTLHERLSGTTPWVACTLTGQPDMPIAIGIVIADNSDTRRAETTAAIQAILQGQLPGAQVDVSPDPLLGGLPAGVTSAWREYGLHLPPHYPLRFLDDITGSDLLGPLVAALAPRGVLRTEAQIILRPAASRVLNAGWRGQAMALLLALQAKADYALADDLKAIEAKLDAVPFAVTLRIVAVAETNANHACDTALNQVAEVLGQYHQRTSHHLQTLVQIGQGSAPISRNTPVALHTRAPRIAPLPTLLLPFGFWRSAAILTSIELAGLWHPPTSGLANLVRWLPCKILPAPPHAYIAPGRANRIMVGQARRGDGTIVPVGPTLRDLRPPLHITAGMGAGKSRALANICQQCIPHGYLLLDGKGDDQGGSLAAMVRATIPLADEQRLILFDVLDTNWPIGLNPLAGIDLSRPGARDQALSQIMAIFARLDPATWGKAPAMKEFVQMATLLVLEGQQNPTLAHVKQCLLDARYRAQLLPHCTNPDVQTFWTVTFPEQGEQQRSSLHALLRRFSQLLTTETTRYLVSQPASRLSFLEAIEERLIVLAPLPHVTLGDLASAIGMLLLQQFVRSAFARPGTDQTRHTYPLIVDELQVFIGKDGDSTDIQNAITQLRGLGIAGIYAHQTLDQLGQLRDEMLTNSGSRLILRTQEPDASIYARLYAASGISSIDIAGQDANEHQYAVLQCDGERTGLFSMQVLPWPNPLDLPVETDTGPDWQTLIPPDSPDPAADQELMSLIYQPDRYPSTVIQLLAGASDAHWQAIQRRWETIRTFHRQYIIDHPGCIALDLSITDSDPQIQATKQIEQQRRDRQRWLSRLLVATPRILAAAEYLRIRRQIEPEDGSLPENSGRNRSRSQRDFAGVQPIAGELIVPGTPQPRAEQIVPIGFVSGATPEPGTLVAVPRITDEQTFDQVMAGRGRRRAKDDIAQGFDDLTAPDDEEVAARDS